MFAFNLAVTLKDYTASLSDFYASLGHESFFSIIKHGILFSMQSVWLCLVYVLSFSWLFDFIELPATLKHNTMLILEGTNEITASLESSDASLLGGNNLHHKGLISGLLNSFFLALPVTVPHLLTLRALYINGPTAAFGYGVGTIAGQALFLFIVLFGWQWLIIPWVKFESVTLVFGMFVLIQALYDIIGNNDVSRCEVWPPGKPPNLKITKWPINVQAVQRVRKYFWINFRLVWFEQMCIFNYFGNLTFGGSSTVLQTSNTQGFMYLFHTFSYWMGLNIGCFILLFFYGWVALKFQYYFTLYAKMTYAQFDRYVHRLGGGLLLAFAFHHVPYYGFDFLTTKTLGFLDQDKALEWIMHPKEHFRFLDPTYTADEFDEGTDKDELVHPYEEDDEFDWEFNFNPKPFDDDNIRGRTETALAYEETDFLPEAHWSMREEIRMRPFTGEDTPGAKNDPYEWVASMKISPLYTRLDQWIDDPAYINGEFDRDYKADDGRRLPGDIMFQDTNTWTILFQEPPQDSGLDFLSGRVFRDDTLELYEQGPFFNEYEMAHRDFRELYTKNKIYRTLMQVNSLASLNNQFATSNLNVRDEYDIYQRRYILQHYLDFVCDYKNYAMLSDGTLEDSFAHRVYNQQFKGTLAVLSQFSAANLGFPDLHWPDNEFQEQLFTPGTVHRSELKKKRSLPVRKPLTFDQPLFNRYHDEHLDWLHEELYSEVPESWWPNLIDDGKGKGKKVRLINNLWNNKKQANYNKRLRTRFKEALRFPAPGLTDQLRHMVLNDSGPFYIGWDGNHGKLIVRSSRLPTSMEMAEWQAQASSKTPPDKWAFQAWPRQTDYDHFWQRIRSPFMHNVNQKNLQNLRQVFRLTESMKGINFRWRYEYLMKQHEAYQEDEELNERTWQPKLLDELPPIGSGELRDITIDEPKQMPQVNFADSRYKLTFDIEQGEILRWERHIYDRFPNFIWFWRFIEVQAENYNRIRVTDQDENWLLPKYSFPLRTYFLHIGQPLPPRLDGIAWPAIDKPNLDRTNMHYNAYLRWKYEVRDYVRPGNYSVASEVYSGSTRNREVHELERSAKYLNELSSSAGVRISQKGIQPPMDAYKTNSASTNTKGSPAAKNK